MLLVVVGVTYTCTDPKKKEQGRRGSTTCLYIQIRTSRHVHVPSRTYMQGSLYVRSNKLDVSHSRNLPNTRVTPEVVVASLL